jgi:hypothetical protein
MALTIEPFKATAERSLRGCPEPEGGFFPAPWAFFLQQFKV